MSGTFNGIRPANERESLYVKRRKKEQELEEDEECLEANNMLRQVTQHENQILGKAEVRASDSDSEELSALRGPPPFWLFDTLKNKLSNLVENVAQAAIGQFSPAPRNSDKRNKHRVRTDMSGDRGYGPHGSPHSLQVPADAVVNSVPIHQKNAVMPSPIRKPATPHPSLDTSARRKGAYFSSYKNWKNQSMTKNRGQPQNGAHTNTPWLEPTDSQYFPRLRFEDSASFYQNPNAQSPFISRAAPPYRDASSASNTNNNNDPKNNINMNNNTASAIASPPQKLLSSQFPETSEHSLNGFHFDPFALDQSLEQFNKPITDGFNFSMPLQAATPFRQPQTPFEQSQTPYGKSQTPYGKSQTPFRKSQTPYGQSQTPYGQSQTPYGQSQTPYGQSQTPYGQSQTPFRESQNPYYELQQTPFSFAKPRAHSNNGGLASPFAAPQTPVHSYYGYYNNNTPSRNGFALIPNASGILEERRLENSLSVLNNSLTTHSAVPRDPDYERAVREMGDKLFDKRREILEGMNKKFGSQTVEPNVIDLSMPESQLVSPTKFTLNRSSFYSTDFRKRMIEEQIKLKEEEKRRHEEKLKLLSLSLTRRTKFDYKAEDLPALTAKDETDIKTALARSGNKNDLVSFLEPENIPVTRDNMWSLENGRWLDDEVINFYMNLIIRRNKEHKLDAIHIFGTHFYTLLQKGFARVKKWTKNIDIFSLKKVLVPCHLDTHWTLAVINFGTKTLEYYDSLAADNLKCFRLLQEYLENEAKEKGKLFDFAEWKTYSPKNIPQQDNGYDCGVFMCRFANARALDQAEFNFGQSEMPYFRKRMARDIYNKVFSV